jgi:hypothetical protein
VETLERAAQPDKQHALTTEHVVIGHDILSLISSAMYTDPLTIYRELLQNAADAIDQAVLDGLIARSCSNVGITIDQMRRKIIVSDNGAGVSNAMFPLTMCSIGGSRKRGTSARGFRGIGRLVGLGYCQELIFRSRSSAQERVYTAAWDCRKLRELLRTVKHSSLPEVIASVVTISSHEADRGTPSHFFEVELAKVSRLANDGLLNSQLIASYLGEVAPVPFHPDFSFGREIQAFLERYDAYNGVNVTVNEGPDRITRPYRDALPVSSSKSSRISAIDFIELRAQDRDHSAVGWIARHDYLGAFPRRLGARGLRARVGNVQIGEDSCLDHVFPETRFNQWAIGEIHVLDNRILPNGRRDDFEPNVHFENLSNQLAISAKEIARRCRSSSVDRRKERSLFELEQDIKEYYKFLKGKRLSAVLRTEITTDLRGQFERAQQRLNSEDYKRWAIMLDRMGRHLDDLEVQSARASRGRASQRQMGHADVLTLLRQHAPAGSRMSLIFLKSLAEQGLI